MRNIGFVVVTCDGGRLGLEEFSLFNVEEDKYIDHDIIDKEDPDFNLSELLDNVDIRVTDISLGSDKLYRFKSKQAASFVATSVNGYVLDLGESSSVGLNIKDCRS